VIIAELSFLMATETKPPVAGFASRATSCEASCEESFSGAECTASQNMHDVIISQSSSVNPNALLVSNEWIDNIAWFFYWKAPECMLLPGRHMLTD
jgi:hypothetical protein